MFLVGLKESKGGKYKYKQIVKKTVRVNNKLQHDSSLSHVKKLNTIIKGVLYMGFLWSLIIGGIIGWLAGLIVGKDIPGGVIGNIIAGFVGAWLGSLILGDWGPSIADFAIIPSIIGAVILVFILSLIMRGMRKTT